MTTQEAVHKVEMIKLTTVFKLFAQALEILESINPAALIPPDAVIPHEYLPTGKCVWCGGDGNFLGATHCAMRAAGLTINDVTNDLRERYKATKSDALISPVDDLKGVHREYCAACGFDITSTGRCPKTHTKRDDNLPLGVLDRLKRQE